jgi:predicted alpha/beta hydrolase family esterase
VVASSDDPYATLDRSRAFARRWGTEFVDAGPIGHINADSFLGEWPEGQRLLDHLVGNAAPGTSRDHPVQAPDRGLPRLRGH